MRHTLGPVSGIRQDAGQHSHLYTDCKTRQDNDYGLWTGRDGRRIGTGGDRERGCFAPDRRRRSRRAQSGRSAGIGAGGISQDAGKKVRPDSRSRPGAMGGRESPDPLRRERVLRTVARSVPDRPGSGDGPWTGESRDPWVEARRPWAPGRVASRNGRTHEVCALVRTRWGEAAGLSNPVRATVDPAAARDPVRRSILRTSGDESNGEDGAWRMHCGWMP